MRMGAAASVVFNLGFGTFNSPVAAYSLLPLLSFQLAAIPSYRNMYSSCFSPDEQASVFAAVSVLESVPSSLAPVVYNQIYAFTVSSFAGAVFYALGITAFTSTALLFSANKAPPRSEGDDIDSLRKKSASQEQPIIVGVSDESAPLSAPLLTHG